MKKTTLVLFAIITMALVNCPQPSGGSVSENIPPETTNLPIKAKEPDAEKVKFIGENLAPGVELSEQKPFPGVLSEKDIMLKAADRVIQENALDPSYYLYEQVPELLYAKLEAPILVHDIYNGTANEYLLLAVNDNGKMLLEVSVNSVNSTSLENWEKYRSWVPSNRPPEYTYHRITKREAQNLFQNTFTGKHISEPVAISGIYLDGSSGPLQNTVFWYTTVRNNVNDAEYEGYILGSRVIGWETISGGLSNLVALNTEDSCDLFLDWNRMAKLDTPLRILETIEAGRNTSGDIKFTPITTENVKYTPVPLR